MARRTLEIILYIGSAATLLIAAAHFVFGSRAIPGANVVNATVDSEDRFYAIIFAGYGLALFHAARSVVQRAKLVRFLAGLFFAGACGRIASWASAGPPNLFFKAMLTLELTLPLVIWTLQARLAREAALTADGTGDGA